MRSHVRRTAVRRTFTVLLVLAAVAGGRFGLAAEFPDRPLKLVVPFPPGGATDAIGRHIARRLATELGQPVVIENKAGANAIVGAEFVSRAAPDGHTLLLATQASLVLNPLLYRRLPYDPVRDLRPLSIVTDVPLVIVVHPSVPAKTLAEFIAHAREHGDRLNYASAGIGNLIHMSAELFKVAADIKMTHVPYKGNGPALSDLIAGQVQVMFDVVGTSLPHIRAGRLRALAVTTSERLALLPDTPTIAESGYPEYRAVAWFGIAVPKDVPEQAVQRLTAGLDRVVTDTEFRGALEGLAYVVHRPRNAEAIANFIEEDRRRWSKLIALRKISLD
jgi:tripartite-type tricarboxylate transporter receptor subunit TctC